MNLNAEMVKDGSAQLPGTPGRKRDEAIRKAILRVAYDTLEADGFRAFSIEKVAARSGAGKTTIYRWWPNKAVLAMDAFLAEFSTDDPCPTTDSVVDDFKARLRTLTQRLAGKNGRVLGSILGGGQDDPETMAQFKEKILMPRREMGRALMQRGIAGGEFRADVDVDATLDAMFLPLFVRLILRLGGCDVAWSDRLVDAVVHGLQPAPTK